MGHICNNCGSQETFSAIQFITEYTKEYITINSEGDVEDYNDSDTYDSEVTSGPENFICDSCESRDVSWEDDEEIIEEIKENVKSRLEGHEQSKKRIWKNTIG